jgi:hypothetical protein
MRSDKKLKINDRKKGSRAHRSFTGFLRWGEKPKNFGVCFSYYFLDLYTFERKRVTDLNKRFKI